MAYYNDPAMSFMTELFDKTTIRYITIHLMKKFMQNIWKV